MTGCSKSKKVIVGMSGGVDSSVAAYLLKEAGYEVFGVTMRMWEDPGEDAGRVAEFLGIPHFTYDVRDTFKKKVINYFTEEYRAGRTPNPCIVCNRNIKWEALLREALPCGAEAVATGHYARVDLLTNGRYAVRKSATSKKDQSYVLYSLTQDQLAHTLFPLGDYEKEDIRRIAEKIGLPVAEKPDSQDICFIPDNDYAGFIESQCPGCDEPGNFVNSDGKILGRHKGIIHYTVGQRRGLNLPMGHPVFVTAIRPESNEVVIGDETDVFTDRLRCSHLNFMSIPDIPGEMKVLAKVRYNHAGSKATVHRIGEDEAEVLFEEPVRAVTPGQSVVFYDGDYVAGGGVII